MKSKPVRGGSQESSYNVVCEIMVEFSNVLNKKSLGSCWMFNVVVFYLMGLRVDIFDPLPNGDLVFEPKNLALCGSDYRQP